MSTVELVAAAVLAFSIVFVVGLAAAGVHATPPRRRGFTVDRNRP